MIHTYSALKGGGLSSLGSLTIHFSILIAIWIILEPITNDAEWVDGLTRPRNLILWLSLVHFSIAVS